MVNIFFPKKIKIKNAPRGQMNRTIKVFQTAPCGQRKFTMHRVVKEKVHCTVWSKFLHRAKNGTPAALAGRSKYFIFQKSGQTDKLTHTQTNRLGQITPLIMVSYSKTKAQASTSWEYLSPYSKIP